MASRGAASHEPIQHPRERAAPRLGEAEAGGRYPPLAVEPWEQAVEPVPDDTVDGDFNGAPELAGLEDSRDWEAADVLDAIEGPEAGLERAEVPPAVPLEELVRERILVLRERTPEARAFGLGALFAAAAEAAAPGAGPLVADESVLRDRLDLLDAALAQLEAVRSDPGARPQRGGSNLASRFSTKASRASCESGEE